MSFGYEDDTRNLPRQSAMKESLTNPIDIDERGVHPIDQKRKAESAPASAASKRIYSVGEILPHEMGLRVGIWCDRVNAFLVVQVAVSLSRLAPAVFFSPIAHHKRVAVCELGALLAAVRCRGCRQAAGWTYDVLYPSLLHHEVSPQPL